MRREKIGLPKNRPRTFFRGLFRVGDIAEDRRKLMEKGAIS
jgi:hypothetical protein